MSAFIAATARTIDAEIQEAPHCTCSGRPEFELVAGGYVVEVCRTCGYRGPQRGAPMIVKPKPDPFRKALGGIRSWETRRANQGRAQ